MTVAILFVLAAASGAVARGLVGQFANVSGGISYGTLTVNVVGSFALGALQGLSLPGLTIVGEGFLGSFTTFSSFTRDVVALVDLKKTAEAGLYLLFTLGLCVAGAALGVWVS